MQKIISFLFAATFPFTGHLYASDSNENASLVIERQNMEISLCSLCRQIVADHSENNLTVMELYDHLQVLLEEERRWNSDLNVELVLQAVAFASEKHAGQKRNYTGVPYIMHPISVIIILLEEGKVKDHFVLAAAALHDTLEDADTLPNEISSLFSETVTSLVQEVTNDPHLTQENKHAWQVEHALKMSPEAKQIKLADRLHNLRSYNEQDFPEGSKQEHNKKTYFTASAGLAKALSGCNENLEIALDETIYAYLK